MRIRRRLPSSQPNHEKQYVPFLLSTTPPTAFEGLNAYCVSIYDQDGRKMESASRIAKKCLYNTLGLYEFNGMLIGLRKHPLHSKEWRTFCWGCRNGRLACATGTFLLIFPPHLTNITSIYATSSAPYLRFSSSYTVLNVGSVVVPSRTPSIYSVNMELGHRHPKLAQCLIFRNTRIAAEALLGYAFVPFVLLLTLQGLQNPFSVAQNTRLLQMGRYLKQLLTILHQPWWLLLFQAISATPHRPRCLPLPVNRDLALAWPSTHPVRNMSPPMPVDNFHLMNATTL